MALWVPPDDAEGSAAAPWCRAAGIEVVGLAAGLPPAVTIWIHAGARVPALPVDVCDALSAHLARGGAVALTLLATPLAQHLGAPGPAPGVSGPTPWRHADDPRWPAAFREWPGYPHIRGAQGWGDHPLLDGFARGTYTWMAREGDLVATATYELPAWPPGGVIAVDRSYVHLHSDCATAWEFEVGGGQLRCVGAHLSLTTGDPVLHPQRDRMLRNLLATADDWSRTRRAWWPGATEQHAPVVPQPRPEPLPSLDEPSGAGPQATVRAGVISPVTLGTPHGLMTGNAADGVRELWLHPLCLLDGGVSLASEHGELQATETRVSGVHMARDLRDTAGHTWREVITGDPDVAAWHYALIPTSAGAPAVAMEWGMPLRWAWPVREDFLHPLRTESRAEGGRHVVIVSGRDRQSRMCVSCEGGDVELLSGEPVPRMRLVGAAGATLRCTWRATVGAPLDRIRGEVVGRGVQRLRELQSRGPAWHDAHDVYDDAMAWAKVRLANFVTGTLHGRRGMVAGYAETRAGWNRSRPGYAWFFGRDTCWSVDALLSLGLFEEARTAIALLASTADVTGKIAHEVTASGVVHYDAADATPLFVRAVARYARWTGDLETVRAWWPAVREALAFVAGCDRDGDGLPENHRVGHGWIEMGPLGGGMVTSYVAACWIDALRQLRPVATRVDPAVVPGLVAMERLAVAGLARLRLPEGGLALHRSHDGMLVPTLTALAAVPIALGVDDSSITMRDLAAARFQAPWGLRMLPVDSPLYAPRGYHAGTVWPLFTGWAAHADAVLGEGERAVARLATVAGLVQRRNLGAFDEVLDGDTGAAAGVCSDQAWSAAALVAPMMHGVLGLDPDVNDGRCTIRLRAPRALGNVALTGLRTGSTRWDARWHGDGCTVSMQHREGPALRITAIEGPTGTLAAGAPLALRAGEA